MLNNSTELKNGILLEFAKTLELFDLTPIEARIFSFLYVEGKPLTLDELSDALGKSKTTMSNGIRNLGELNLVKRVWKRGVRKDLYQANKQLYRTLLSSYIKKWNDATEIRNEAVIELKYQFDQLREEEKDEDLQEKLEEILTFHTKLDSFFKEASEIKK
ncbi:GbsR/MarR family transcriptional regulator [Ornithinibacillus halotolerans]|uniref:HTH-type transcriptional regulator n=1 Tax=Ornithinibacillus halotolerans TaxID=1274357 RepID=A0A916RVT3_9BACI|nr:MarR family transcriptional regulator [Ornithinibacillus halotolerans]GGA73463.1 hypothetical protein GCM10008025_16450 [Ornithinibacillus halotolerans]